MQRGDKGKRIHVRALTSVAIAMVLAGLLLVGSQMFGTKTAQGTNGVCGASGCVSAGQSVSQDDEDATNTPTMVPTHTPTTVPTNTPTTAPTNTPTTVIPTFTPTVTVEAELGEVCDNDFDLDDVGCPAPGVIVVPATPMVTSPNVIVVPPVTNAPAPSGVTGTQGGSNPVSPSGVTGTQGGSNPSSEVSGATTTAPTVRSLPSTGSASDTSNGWAIPAGAALMVLGGLVFAAARRSRGKAA